MNFAKELKNLSPEEIRDRLAELSVSAERDADKLKALELLCKVNRMIGHGNSEPKDFREVVIGVQAGESTDDK